MAEEVASLDELRSNLKEYEEQLEQVGGLSGAVAVSLCARC